MKRAIDKKDFPLDSPLDSFEEQLLKTVKDRKLSKKIIQLHRRSQQYLAVDRESVQQAKGHRQIASR